MKKKYDWEKITRYALNESDGNERMEIEKEIQNDSNLEKTIQEIRRISSLKKKPLKITSAEAKWEEVKKDLNDLQPQKRVGNEKEPYLSDRLREKTFSIWRYAAVLLVTLIAAYYLSQKVLLVNNTAQQEQLNVLAVKYGERKTVVLYDGTIVNLDSGSELRYPKNFNKGRTVYLKGEAFFQVAKNPNKPFRVFVDNALIKVIGTKFNIRSWDEDKKGVILTVSEGIVSLSDKDASESDKVILYKNMQSVLHKDGKISKPIYVDASQYTRWMYNEKHFKNASLKEVLSQLERWTGIQFEGTDSLMEKKNLSVHITNTNLDDVLELISKITDTKVIHMGNKVTFMKR